MAHTNWFLQIGNMYELQGLPIRMAQIEVVDEKNQHPPPLHRNTHHDDNHKLNANYERTTMAIHLDQTNHNMKGGTQPKKTAIEWCRRKKEGTKKKQ